MPTCTDAERKLIDAVIRNEPNQQEARLAVIAELADPTWCSRVVAARRKLNDAVAASDSAMNEWCSLMSELGSADSYRLADQLCDAAGVKR